MKKPPSFVPSRRAQPGRYRSNETTSRFHRASSRRLPYDDVRRRHTHSSLLHSVGAKYVGQYSSRRSRGQCPDTKAPAGEFHTRLVVRHADSVAVGNGLSGTIVAGDSHGGSGPAGNVGNTQFYTVDMQVCFEFAQLIYQQQAVYVRGLIPLLECIDEETVVSRCLKDINPACFHGRSDPCPVLTGQVLQSGAFLAEAALPAQQYQCLVIAVPKSSLLQVSQHVEIPLPPACF